MRLVRRDSELILDIRLPERFKSVRSVKRVSELRLDIWLVDRFKVVRLVKRDSGLRLTIALPDRFKVVNAVAVSRPVRLTTLSFGAENVVSVSISSGKIGASAWKPSAVRSADFKLSSRNVHGSGECNIYSRPRFLESGQVL